MSEQKELNVLITGGTAAARTVVAGALHEDLERRKFTNITTTTPPMSMMDAVGVLLGDVGQFDTPVRIQQFDLTSKEDYHGASEAVSGLMETMFEADVAPEPPKRTEDQIQQARIEQIKRDNAIFGKLYEEEGDSLVLDAANEMLRKAGQSQRVVSFTTTDGATYGPVEA